MIKKSLAYAFIMFLGLFIVPFAVFARGRHHTPPPVPPPPAVSSPAPSGLTWGAFTGNSQILGSYKAVFIGDGDDFTQDFGQYKVPLVVYWESSMNATQAGQASFLKTWASEMKSYPNQIIFVPLDEMNGNWSAYYGNPSAFKSAFASIYGMFHGGNVQVAWDPNNDPSNLMASYFPGTSSVDICGVDGFDFGGQNWQSVFIGDNAIPTLKSLCPSKPIWILSTGSVDNQSLFISDMISGAKTYGINGVIYFDYQQFVIPASTLSQL